MEAMMAAFVAKIPAGRMGDPDDIGKVAAFLCSGGSDYMTGETVVVDGGMLLS
jgi:NAD(P)-dependent dehydrogenase (short-subunit alcohol dehydrogenase family)